MVLDFYWTYWPKKIGKKYFFCEESGDASGSDFGQWPLCMHLLIIEM